MSDLKSSVSVNFSVYSSNIASIVSIYEDSEKVRLQNRNKLLLQLEEFEEWSNEDFDRFSHYEFHFDWLLMQALFISGFSYFENYMRSIAKVLERETNSKIKLRDLKGNGIIDTYRKYINLIGDIGVASSQITLWRELQDFKFVRNTIIHNYGKIDKSNNLIEKYDLYFGSSKRLIRIKKFEFLKEFCAKSIEYMQEISNEINMKY